MSNTGVQIHISTFSNGNAYFATVIGTVVFMQEFRFAYVEFRPQHRWLEGNKTFRLQRDVTYGRDIILALYGVLKASI